MKNCCLPRRCWPGSPLTPPRPKPSASPLPPPTRRSNRWTPTTRSSASISIWPTRCASRCRRSAPSPTAFDSLIAALKFKKYDAVISGMDITPERSKQVAFTQPYYANSAIVIAQRQVQLAGGSERQKLGMENGTTHQKYMQDKHPEISTVSYDSYQNAILELKTAVSTACSATPPW